MTHPITRARTARGLSRDDLARLAGVSERSIRRLENGEYEPRIGMLKKMAPHLGVRWWELANGGAG